MKHVPVCRAVLGLHLALGACGSWAQAKDPQESALVEITAPFRQFNKVEITGSSILRKEQTQQLPVQIITQDDIKKGGFSNLAEVLQAHPVMSNMLNSSLLSEVKGGYTNAAIHGMPTGTLVLIDGQRMASYGRQSLGGVERSSVDLGLLPLAAIERIEMLTDGASSLYGTDAMAGVVNVITRKEIKGAEISTYLSVPDGQKGQGKSAQLSWGQGKLETDGHSWMLSAEVSQRDRLLGADRPYASQGIYNFDSDGKNYTKAGSMVLSFPYSSPGTIYSINANGSVKFTSPLFSNGTCPSAYVVYSGYTACNLNLYKDRTIYPSSDSKRLTGLGRWRWSENAIVYAQAIYSQETEVSSIDTWDYRNTYLGKTPGSPGYDLVVAAGLNPADNNFLLWGPSGVGLRDRQYSKKNWRVATGIKGVFNAWDYHASLYHAQSEVERHQGNFDRTSFTFGNGGILNLNNTTTALTRDSALFAQMQAISPMVLMDKGTTQLDAIEFKASRPLFENDGKDAMLGLGFDFRQEAVSFTPGISSQPAFSGKRNIVAGFTEVQIPVTYHWDVMASLRSDRYSDIGTTTNGKLATRLQVDKYWAARASLGTGFRAPTIGQLAQRPEPYYSELSSAAWQCSTQMIAIAKAMGGQCVNENYRIYSNGNKDLRPETSVQKSLGLAWVPHRNLNFSADYWRVDIQGQLDTLSASSVVSNPDAYANRFILSSAGNLGLILPPLNLQSSSKDGIDFEARWRSPTDWGQLLLAVAGTRMLNSTKSLNANTKTVSDLGKFSNETGTVTPKLSTRFTAALANAQWSGQVAINYTANYEDADFLARNNGVSSTVTGHRVPAWITVDVYGIYKISPTLKATATVFNLSNAQAPLSFSQTATGIFGANPVMSNLWGRTVQLGITANY